VAKFPHAMALHGIQLFIGASVVARLGRLDGRRQLNAVRMTVGGYSALVAWSIVHTNAGRAPLDLGGVEAVLCLVGVALLAGAALLLGAGFRRSATSDAVAQAAVTLAS
jgi:hypothetical protein